jgi:tripartite-type tricarboxylate transporter receptor subunit TctC
MRFGKLLALACLVLSAAAYAQGPGGYPSKPVRLIVPYGPGGPTDIIARIVSNGLGKELGVAVVVENKPGASGNLGIEQLIKSAPDGYTIGMVAASTMAINPVLFPKLTFVGTRDLTAVGPIAVAPNVLLASARTGAKNFDELMAYVKARRGQINFGSGGAGNTSHLQGMILNNDQNLGLQHISFKGEGEALTALARGDLHLMFSGMLAGLPHVTSRNAVPIALASPERSKALPDVPTFNELKIRGLDFVPWYGISAPNGTPPEIVRYLNASLIKALRHADLRARFAQLMIDPIEQSPEEFDRYIKAEAARLKPIVEASGARSD